MSMSVLDIDSIALRHGSMTWENVMVLVMDDGWMGSGFPFRRGDGTLEGSTQSLSSKYPLLYRPPPAWTSVQEGSKPKVLRHVRYLVHLSAFNLQSGPSLLPHSAITELH